MKNNIKTNAPKSLIDLIHHYKIQYGVNPYFDKITIHDTVIQQETLEFLQRYTKTIDIKDCLVTSKNEGFNISSYHIRFTRCNFRNLGYVTNSNNNSYITFIDCDFNNKALLFFNVKCVDLKMTGSSAINRLIFRKCDIESLLTI